MYILCYIFTNIIFPWYHRMGDTNYDTTFPLRMGDTNYDTTFPLRMGDTQYDITFP